MRTITFLTLLLITTLLNAQENIINDVSAALKSGYVDAIENNSADNITLKIINNQNDYPKSEATKQLKKFFKKNKPNSYNILHKGNKGNSTFVIGNLQTTNGDYRIFYLITDNKIQQIKIEKN